MSYIDIYAGQLNHSVALPGGAGPKEPEAPNSGQEHEVAENNRTVHDVVARANYVHSPWEQSVGDSQGKDKGAEQHDAHCSVYQLHSRHRMGIAHEDPGGMHKRYEAPERNREMEAGADGPECGAVEDRKAQRGGHTAAQYASDGDVQPSDARKTWKTVVAERHERCRRGNGNGDVV